MLINVGDMGADYVKLTPAIKDWLLQNKCRFVCRYAVPLETTKIGKVITDEEIKWLHAHGIGIFLNFEINHEDADKGYEFGRKNGRWLQQFARSIGYPTNVPLFASVDTDTWAGNLVRHREYIEGFNVGIGEYPLGIYGDDDIAYACMHLYPIVWLANAKAWSGTLDSRIVVHFRQGSSQAPGVDPNMCLSPVKAWGLDMPPTVPPKNVLTVNQRLYPGDYLIAEDGTTFWHQHDGNLVLYSHDHKVLWYSGTENHETAYLTPQADGNLVLYAPDGHAVWHTRTHGQATVSALVCQPRRITLLGNNWKILWSNP